MLGVIWLVGGVLWLSWRSREKRIRALRRAAESTGVRMRRTAPADARRLALGVGMIAVVDPSAADSALARLHSRGMDAWIMGQVEDLPAD